MKLHNEELEIVSENIYQAMIKIENDVDIISQSVYNENGNGMRRVVANEILNLKVINRSGNKQKYVDGKGEVERQN